MNQKLNLRELKGAPLSIILAIVMSGNRTVSMSFLCTETGYSDKTVANGLNMLRDRQIITETRRNHYQLTGNNYQLPLYWDEKIEPSSSVSQQQEELPGISGDFPESGIIPVRSNNILEDHEARIRALEAEIASLKAGNSTKTGEIPNDPESVSSAQTGNSPKESGEIPTLINNQSKNIDTENEKSLIDCAEILDQYHRYGQGCQFTESQLQELGAAAVDLDVLEFVLPRAHSFESAMEWVKRDMRHAKYHLLKRLGVTMPALQKLTDDPDVSLWLIDYSYWKWYLVERVERPGLTLGWVVAKIQKGYDRITAENTSPCQVRFL